MQKTFLLGLLLSLQSSLWAQKSFTVSGYVEDALSRERIIGVNLYIDGSTIGTTTNTFGYYSLSLPPGEYDLIVSFIGFESLRQKIVITNKNLNLDFELKEAFESLEEVTVTAEEAQVEQVQMSQVQLSVSEIKKIPAFLGEVDIIRAIQLLPGVQSGNEGTTGFYVRGGSPDQNLILLDGVPVYNASHLNRPQTDLITLHSSTTSLEKEVSSPRRYPHYWLST